jgi:hypothetical protein
MNFFIDGSIMVLPLAFFRVKKFFLNGSISNSVMEDKNGSPYTVKGKSKITGGEP